MMENSNNQKKRGSKTQKWDVLNGKVQQMPQTGIAASWHTGPRSLQHVFSAPHELENVLEPLTGEEFRRLFHLTAEGTENDVFTVLPCTT